MQEIERSTEIVTQINCFFSSGVRWIGAGHWTACIEPFDNFLSISLLFFSIKLFTLSAHF